jgi:hypothetical protein
MRYAYEYKTPGMRTWKRLSVTTLAPLPESEVDGHRKNVAARLTRETGSPHDWRDVQIREVSNGTP